MEILIAIIIGLFCLISAFVLPWINRSQIDNLKDTIKQLRYALEKEGINIPVTQERQLASEIIKTQTTVKQQDSKKAASKTVTKSKVKAKTPEKPKIGFEQQFGARLPVWIGGVALALAGFFLVKYSIDNNLLSPIVRVILGGTLGLGLLYSAKWVRGRPNFANGVRIAQSLAGAGIAVLYVASFASARLYELIPVYAGFIAMALITATALVLAIRHGPPIALLGMAGGFLTPALLSTGGGNAFTLFIYLYFTASGLLIVVRKTDWWWLSIPTIVASLLWVVVWLLSSYHPGDSIWLGLFLAGISATIVINSRKQYEEDGGGTYKGALKLTSILNYIGLGGTLLLMGVIAGKAGFGPMEWGLFGMLAAGGIGLAYFNDKLYGFVPFISMAVNAVMLFMWRTPDAYMLALTLAVFVAIYTVSGYFLIFRSKRPILWAGLTGATGLSYYLLAYYKLHKTALFTDISMFWGIAALILAVGSIHIIMRIREEISDYGYKEHLYAIFAVAATSFISLALSIELKGEFLSVAIAAEMLAIAWINGKVSIRALRPIAAVLACIFGLLLLPQIILMIQLTIYSLVEAKLYLQSNVPIVHWPLFQLGAPAGMFLGSAYLLRQQQDDRIIHIFEIAAISLIAVMGYYFTRNSLNPEQNVLFIKAGFFERGVITNILFVYGLSCLWIGRRYMRTAFSWSGIVLCGIAAFRIIYFDMLIHNPLFEMQKIGGVAIFNTLLLPFGLPLAWAYFARKELISFNKEKWASYISGFMLAVLFTLISLNVRHIFHGEFLKTGITTNAEIYSYSVAWLLLGVVLLFFGTLKQDKLLRLASLGVILLTIGKVFLYDASELEGLFRVFSFLGLGLSLIGLSYFYTRFVFGEDKER